MKKHINLFNSKKSQEELAPLVVKAKKYGVITLISLLLLLGIETGGFFFLENMSLNLTTQQTSLAAFVQSNRILENKIAFFLFKKNLLTRFMRDDAKFSAYYNLFQTILNTAKLNVKLESFSVDKDRKTEFTLSFESYKDSQDFMKNIETSLFLDSFKELKIISFSEGSRKLDANLDVKVYRIELKGVFKEINENKS